MSLLAPLLEDTYKGPTSSPIAIDEEYGSLAYKRIVKILSEGNTDLAIRDAEAIFHKTFVFNNECKYRQLSQEKINGARCVNFIHRYLGLPRATTTSI